MSRESFKKVSDERMFEVLRSWVADKVEEYIRGILPTSGHSLTYVYPQVIHRISTYVDK